MVVMVEKQLRDFFLLISPTARGLLGKVQKCMSNTPSREIHLSDQLGKALFYWYRVLAAWGAIMFLWMMAYKKWSKVYKEQFVFGQKWFSKKR